MKVILLKDIKGVGRANDTVDTSDGHALNFLIPQKLAITATPVAVKEAGLRRKQAKDRSDVEDAFLVQNIATLADARITIRAKSNEKNHLYDAVGEPEIRSAIKKQERVELPEGAIKLEKPIKELGTFDIPVSVGELFGTFKIVVEAE